MARPRDRVGKRKASSLATMPPFEVDVAALRQHVRPVGERRSKAREDTRRVPTLKSRGLQKRASPPAKRSMVIELTSSEEEAAPECEHSGGMSEREQSWSRGYPTYSNTKDSEDEDNDVFETLKPLSTRKGGGTTGMKKHVELDVQGQPFGSMKAVLCSDIKKYAKDLDPTTGWEGQPRHERKRLFKRLYTDWQMCGHCDKVCEKWMRPIVTKVLINTRWRLNQLIDNNAGKPADVDPEHWKTLVAMRATEAAQVKSEHMRSISKKKGSTTTQMKVIEREVVSRLTMLKNRLPYDAEVDAEVAKEYERLQEEKRRVRPDHGKEIEAVRTRVSDLEGTVTRLGENLAASHKRMEDMMQKILQNQGKKQGNAGEDMMEPSSSAQMLDTSALTSTTVDVTTRVHQPVPAPLLSKPNVKPNVFYPNLGFTLYSIHTV